MKEDTNTISNNRSNNRKNNQRNNQRNNQKILLLPPSERPYELCWEKGAAALTDAQLLAVILRTGSKEMDVLTMAQNILQLKEGNLLSIIQLSRGQLLKVPGMGKVKVMQLECIVELALRLSETAVKSSFQITNAKDVAEYYMQRMRHYRQEHLLALFLDTKCHLLQEKTLSIGTVNGAMVSQRDLYVEALRAEAVYVILLHNHPSGDPTPSKEDLFVTRKVYESGMMIGIELLDHIIIGDNKYISMKEKGEIRNGK